MKTFYSLFGVITSWVYTYGIQLSKLSNLMFIICAFYGRGIISPQIQIDR